MRAIKMRAMSLIHCWACERGYNLFDIPQNALRLLKASTHRMQQGEKKKDTKMQNGWMSENFHTGSEMNLQQKNELTKMF